MILFGASGHGAVVLDALIESGKVLDFFTDDRSIKEFMGYDVLNPKKLRSEVPLCIAIGDNLSRKKIAERFIGFNFQSIIHPKSIVSNTSQIGTGTVVMAGAIVNTRTLIGNHVILNTKSSVDHDCTIADYVHIAPGATLCGGVKVGKSSFVGAGSTILPNLVIGENVIIGAGAVVTQNIASNTRVKGIPAKEF